MMLPGVMDGRFHPFYSVCMALRELRLRRAQLFSAMVLACGDNKMAAMADHIINEDLYQKRGAVRFGWSIPTVTRYPELCEKVCELSVNPLWRTAENAKARATSQKPPDEQDSKVGKLIDSAQKEGKIQALLLQEKHKTHQFMRLQEAQNDCEDLADGLRDRLRLGRIGAIRENHREKVEAHKHAISAGLASVKRSCWEGEPNGEKANTKGQTLSQE